MKIRTKRQGTSVTTVTNISFLFLCLCRMEMMFIRTEATQERKKTFSCENSRRLCYQQTGFVFVKEVSWHPVSIKHSNNKPLCSYPHVCFSSHSETDFNLCLTLCVIYKKMVTSSCICWMCLISVSLALLSGSISKYVIFISSCIWTNNKQRNIWC